MSNRGQNWLTLETLLDTKSSRSGISLVWLHCRSSLLYTMQYGTIISMKNICILLDKILAILRKKEFLKWLAWYLVKDWLTCFLRRQSSPKKTCLKSSKRPKSLFTGCSPCVYYFVLHPSSESSKCWKTSYLSAKQNSKVWK